MYKLILVDDEPMTLQVLKSIVDWEAYQCIIIKTYDNGLDAYHGILALRPDAVITDVRMAAMTGIDMITAIRKAGLDTEFIIISAYRNFDVAQKAIEQQALSYLLKPLRVEEIKKAAHKLQNRLSSKADNPLPIYDLDYPESMPKALFQTYLKQAASHFHCCRVVVADNPVTWPDTDAIAIHPVNVRQYPYCYLLSSSNLRPALPSKLLGCSRVRESFADFPDMLNEAIVSLSGGFEYSDNDAASLMQYYAGKHYAENISLTTLCEEFHASESYVCSLFKKHIDCSFIEFLQAVRINQAKRLLAFTDLDSISISYQCGFNNYSYFGRLFKKLTDTTPLSYRKVLKADPNDKKINDIHKGSC